MEVLEEEEGKAGRAVGWEEEVVGEGAGRAGVGSHRLP